MYLIAQTASKNHRRRRIAYSLLAILTWVAAVFAEEPHPFEWDHEPLHPTPPWLETMTSEWIDQQALSEYDSDFDLSPLLERSETPPFVRIQPSTGTISSIQGRFPSGDPLQTFFDILTDLDLPQDPAEWVVLAEGSYGDSGQHILRLERRNSQDLPLAGGQIQLIFDDQMIYAIEGRLAGYLPSADQGPWDAQAVLEATGGERVMGPLLFDPQYSTIEDIDLSWPQQPTVVFSVIGAQFSALVDSFGETVHRFDWTMDQLPQGEDILAQQSSEAIAFSLVENISGSRWTSESTMTHSIDPQYLNYMDPYFGSFVLNLSFWYLYLPGYLSWNSPYWREFTLANKGGPATNLKGFTKQDWDLIIHSLMRISVGLGSYYATEPNRVVAFPNGMQLGYQGSAGRRIWLERLATMVWFETAQKPVWKMRNLTVDQRKSLWNIEFTYDYGSIYNHDTYFYNWNKTGFGASHRPIAEYTFLRAKGIIDLTSMANTAANLAHYFRQYMRHKGSRFNATKQAWDRNIVKGHQVHGLNPEHLRVLNYRDPVDQFSVTWGCWHTTAMMCSLLRQLGIPAENRQANLSPNSFHSRILLPALNQSVLHSDDFYTVTAVTGQVNHQHLFKGSHMQPGRQQFRIPKNDIFLSSARVAAILDRSYTSLNHGVAVRGTSCHVSTLSGSKTADDAHEAAVRRAYMVEWGGTQLEWYHMLSFLNDELPDYLIRWDKSNPLKPQTYIGYAEDFGLTQREVAYRLAYQLIQAKGLANLNSTSYQRSKAFKNQTMPIAPQQCP